MVIAVLARAGEGDDILRTIGKSHSQRVGHEGDARQHVGGEHQYMAQAQRLGWRIGALRQHRGASFAYQPTGGIDLERSLGSDQFGIRGAFAKVDEHTMRVFYPQPGPLEPRRCGGQSAACARHCGSDAGQVIRAQRDVMQPLAQVAAQQDDRIAVLPGAAQPRDMAISLGDQAGVGVKGHALRQVGHFERKRQRS